MKIRILHFPAEIIVARVIEETESEVIIERPLMAVIDPIGGGAILMEPLWSVASTSSKFNFNKNNILQILSPQEKLENKYLTASSPIKVPQAKDHKNLKIK